VHSIEAHIRRAPDGTLALTYDIAGDLDRIRIPEPALPCMSANLWQHTCCEIFVRRHGQAAYHEFNFAPSREWAAYGFQRYREGVPLIDEALKPEIAIETAEGKLELRAIVRLSRLSTVHARARLAIAISAVIEGSDGELSYWALAHPRGQPDFHDPHAFTLELDEIRN
jgi:hypothetical protein